jgi:hypothetical protein
MNELSNFDIIDICHKDKLPLKGIHSKNVLPLKLENGFYIINLADDDADGTHWTCLYKYNPSLYFYYDSFGFPPPLDIEQRVNGNMIINNKEVQDMEDTSCGYYCIAFIKYMTKSRHKNPIQSFNKFISLFKNNTYVNEVVLNDILYG